jgi:hypothetical protein
MPWGQGVKPRLGGVGRVVVWGGSQLQRVGNEGQGRGRGGAIGAVQGRVPAIKSFSRRDRG